MICEYCNKEHDGLYGSGRFCSQHCARGFASSYKREEANKKIGYSLEKRNALRNDLKELVDKGNSVNEISKILNKAYSTIRYWLRKFGFSTQWSGNRELTKYCTICGKEKPKPTGRRVCPACSVLLRRIRTKLGGVELLGGKCQRCGIEATINNLSIFVFHHTSSNEKEFTIGSVANKSWEVIKKEILKCKLLCLNCHGLEHSKRDATMFEYAIDYKGVDNELGELVFRWKGKK